MRERLQQIGMELAERAEQRLGPELEHAGAAGMEP